MAEKNTEKMFYRKDEVMDMILEDRAVEFGEFKLKKHEKNPNLPLSPIYLNLRTPDNPSKPGSLTLETIEAMASLICQKALIGLDGFEYVVGIPWAGDPLAKAFSKFAFREYDRLTPVIELEKKTENGRRWINKIASEGFKKGERVLLLDDLITGADSKLEAIEVLERAGLKIAKIMVLINRQQGGDRDLRKLGYNFSSIFTLTELLNYYLKNGKIDQTKYDQAVEYLKRN